ncbi:hypothetical protein BH10PSE19_BH10PSE19_11370 [soil metagenome]
MSFKWVELTLLPPKRVSQDESKTPNNSDVALASRLQTAWRKPDPEGLRNITIRFFGETETTPIDIDIDSYCTVSVLKAKIAEKNGLTAASMTLIGAGKPQVDDAVLIWGLQSYNFLCMVTAPTPSPSPLSVTI